jgi:DNA-binding transcriptional LysR family regulator
MELRHLRYFVAVAEEGGFVRAARRLRIAQPALSRQIRDLEREIGVELIDRDSRSTHLTPGGDAVLHETRWILDRVSHSIERARQANHGLAGRCVVCVGKLPIWNGMVARLVEKVRRDYPMIELDVSEGVTRAQWMAVRSGKVDLGIGIAPTREFDDLEWQRLNTERFDAALLPASHHLVSRKSVRLTELAAEPIIAGFRLDADHHRMCVKVSRRATPPTPLLLVETLTDAFAQIASGVGWTPFMQSLAEWVRAGTVMVPVEDLDATLVMHVIWKRGALTAVVQTVRDALIDIARDSPAGSPVRSKSGPADAPGEGGPDDSSPNEVPVALELRHLRYYLTILGERSIGQAATKLSITQPTLSRQMHDLERIIGVALLERRTRGAVATPAGTEFATVARQILDRVDALGPEANRAARGATGRCIVATIPPAVVERLLASLLHRVATELPDVRVGFVEIPTPQQAEALLAGHIDVGICNSFTSVTPYLTRLRNDRLLDDAVRCALLAKDHPLASRTEISLLELRDLPFLFMPRSLYPSFYDRVMTVFAAHDFRPTIEQPYNGLETTWSIARRGDGWCIGFHTSLLYPPAGLAAVRVRELNLPWGIDMLYRRDETRAMVLGVTSLIRSVAVAEAARWQLESSALSRGGQQDIAAR